MAKLTGVFEKFTTLHAISINAISGWLNTKGDLNALYNIVGNRILYPQTTSASKEDLQIDMAIFKEVLKKQPDLVIDNSKRILIPEEIYFRFPSLVALVLTIVETVPLPEVSGIYVEENGQEDIVGTYVRPKNLRPDLAVLINDQPVKVTFNAINVLPFSGKVIHLKTDNGLGMSVVGGNVGVIIDLRTA